MPGKEFEEDDSQTPDVKGFGDLNKRQRVNSLRHAIIVSCTPGKHDDFHRELVKALVDSISPCNRLDATFEPVRRRAMESEGVFKILSK